MYDATHLKECTILLFPCKDSKNMVNHTFKNKMSMSLISNSTNMAKKAMKATPSIYIYYVHNKNYPEIKPCIC